MDNECFARFGGLTFLFSGWLPEPEDGEHFSHFRISNGQPDIHVHLTSVPEILYPKGRVPDFSSFYLRSFRDGDVVHRYYRSENAEVGEDHAHACYSEAQPDFIDLQICERKLRWSFQQVLSRISIEELLLRRNMAILHASWIEREGQAIAFFGRSGIGKSTQAALWERYRGTPVRNGDRTLLKDIDGEEFACGLPYAGTSGICTNTLAPLRAFVKLGQGKKNSIRRLPTTEAAKALLSQMPFPKWSPERMTDALDVAVRVSSRVPVYELVCLPDRSAVETLETALAES